MKKRKKKKKFKIKILNVFLAILLICLVFYGIFHVLELPITNIYIKGNTLYSDQEIIRIAKIENYPSTFAATCNGMEKKLKKDTFIAGAKVRKKFLTRVYIEVDENYPLYYDATKSETVLKNGVKVKKELNTMVLVNEVPKKIKDKLFNKLGFVDREILNRVSELKYAPDQVDKELFIATMSDGNYVYLTLSKFTEINKYINYVKEFNNKKGILYLNSGEYFKIIE